MNHPTLIIAALFCSTAVAAPEQTTCDSPCDCRDAHGKGRLAVKRDTSIPPADASAIQAVTPSDVYGWAGPDARVTLQSERTGIENKWLLLLAAFSLCTLKRDGDLHIELGDTMNPKPGIVVCEVPAESPWCEIRTTVF